MQVSKWVTLGAGMVFILILAAYMNAPQLYYMAAILLTLPAVSYCLGWFTLRGVVISRLKPRAGRAGEVGCIQYSAINRSRVARFFLTITESLPVWVESISDEPVMFNIPARGSADHEDAGEVVVTHSVRYRKRGVVPLRGFDVIAIDPLGVFGFTQHFPQADELVVYPEVRPLASFGLSGADRYGWNEFTSTALRGASVDPDGVRAYVHGDPLRRIHWRQTARTGKLAVIEFEEPQTIKLALLMDLHRSAHTGHGLHSTLEAGVTFAASLADGAIRSGAAVRLVIPEDLCADTAIHTSFKAADSFGRGEEHLLQIMDALARVEATSTVSAAQMTARVAGDMAMGTTFVVITPQADAALARALTAFVDMRSHVGVVYIDLAEAAAGSKRSTDSWINDLLAIRVHPFRYRPEHITEKSAV